MLPYVSHSDLEVKVPRDDPKVDQAEAGVAREVAHEPKDHRKDGEEDHQHQRGKDALRII